MRRTLFLSFILYTGVVYGMSQLVEVSTQTDDYLNNRQLTEITPQSSDSDRPPIPLEVIAKPSSEHSSNESPVSPQANISLEVEVRHRNCFKCRCKLKFKRAVETAGAGTVGAAIGTVIAILLL